MVATGGHGPDHNGRGFGGNGGPSCPDADLLAGLACGRLLPEERQRVERHVEACEHCRGIVAAIARQAEAAPTATATPRRAGVRPALAAAAALLVTFGAWAAWNAFREVPPERDRVASVFAELTNSHPELVANLELPSEAELAAPSPAVTRGGVTLLAPVGTVLDHRPAFRWEPVTGITSWTVTLSTDELRELWQRETAQDALAWPADAEPLTAGTSIVRVAGTGPAGPVDVEQAFTVAAAAERDAFARSAQVIAQADPSVADLALAQLALAQDLLGEAEQAARRHCRAHPESRIGALTLRCVLRRIGASEAETLEIPEER